MAKKKNYQRTIKGKAREFAELAVHETKEFGQAALHVAGGAFGFRARKKPQEKEARAQVVAANTSE